MRACMLVLARVSASLVSCPVCVRAGGGAYSRHTLAFVGKALRQYFGLSLPPIPHPTLPIPQPPPTSPLLLRRLGWHSALMGSSFEAHVGAAPPVGAHTQGLSPGCCLSLSLSLCLPLPLPLPLPLSPVCLLCLPVGRSAQPVTRSRSQSAIQSVGQTDNPSSLLTKAPTHAPTPWSAGAHTALHRHERRRRRTPLCRAQQRLLQGLQLQVWHVPCCNDSGAGKWRGGVPARRRCACVMCQILDR